MRKIFLILCFSLSLGFGLRAQDYEPYLSEADVSSSVKLLPPPPAEGSIEFLMDKIAYWEYYKLRFADTVRARQAIIDADMSDKVLLQFKEAFGLEITKESMPETYLLLMRSKECFGSSGSNEAKRTYRRTRPFVYFNTQSLTPDDDWWMRQNYSYPSGHTANFFGLAFIMTDLRPECREALQKRAEQGGISRAIVGAHWASDVAAGRAIACAVYEVLQRNPEYQAQFKKAQEEVARILKLQKD